jgi:hypothetical protein
MSSAVVLAGREKQVSAALLPAILMKIREKADKKVAAGCLLEVTPGCWFHENRP